MNSRLLAAACGLAAILAAPVVVAQDDAATADPAPDPLEAEAPAEPETWADFSIKAYKIRFFGGWFGGSEYLNLPVRGPRSFEEAGAQRVMSFDGTWWEPGELDYRKYDGPVKRIEDGKTFGMTIAAYLADNFHMDITASYTTTQAVLTMMNIENRNAQFREEIDRDDSVSIYRGSLQLMYDLAGFRVLGFSPYLGFGFGGVINRFSNLDDVGELMLIGTAGVQRRFGDRLEVFMQANLSNFSMAREELHYTTSVTYTDLSGGVSFFFDVVPPEIRAQHEAQKADRRRRR